MFNLFICNFMFYNKVFNKLYSFDQGMVIYKIR